jgi:uncharacterized protein YidB (DUF937 family)
VLRRDQLDGVFLCGMGGLTARRPRWPRLVGTGRAGAIGAAALAVTGTADVLLADVARQPWQPTLASVLILAPGLYFAYKAIPPAALRGRGRRAGAWDPEKLGVHRVAGGGCLTPYIRRPHDDVLDALLDPAVRRSRLVAIRGGSSTGKTRAAYEAVSRRQLAGWRLDYPRGEAGLSTLLDAGIRARTILWLDELRDYTSGTDRGTTMLDRLAQLLEDQDQVIVVTTMWPEHWTAYTDAARTAPGLAQDPAGAAGRLLARLPSLSGYPPADLTSASGGVIDVPLAFTAEEVIAATRTDPVLADAATAAASAGQTGHLAQYLAAVPDLLDRYQGAAGDRYGRAVIIAAMDAARLGCQNPLTEALLLEAAPGYLADPADRTKPVSAWGEAALAWATEMLRGAVQAVQPVPPTHGIGIVGYRPADYLDQHGRNDRQQQVGPTELWDAVTTHTGSAADLVGLAHAAEGYGLYRRASLLWTRAAAFGAAGAAAGLIAFLGRVCPASVIQAGAWAADQASLDNPTGISRLLEALHKVGATDAVTNLASRAADQASLDNPTGISRLLEALHKVGATGAVTALLDRRPADHARLDNSWGVGALLEALHKVGATDAVTTLASRAASHARLDDPADASLLLATLRLVGITNSITTLASRAASHVRLDDSWVVGGLLEALHEVGATDAVAMLASRAASHARLDDPAGSGRLLDALREAGATGTVAALLVRDPADYASLDNPWNVSTLLFALHRAGVTGAATALASRAVASASLDNPGITGSLLYVLGASDPDAITALLARQPADYASLDDPAGSSWLLDALRESGAADAVTALLARQPADHASLDRPQDVARLVDALRNAGATDAVRSLAERAGAAGIPSAYLADPVATAWLGREPDFTPSAPWSWQEPTDQNQGT